jgi:outer membrane protein assembly factor BamB
MTRSRRTLRGIAGAAVALLALAGSGEALAATTSTTTTVPDAAPSWTVYHGGPEGGGVATSVSSVHLASPAWTSPALDGELYGEPLVSGGHVFVATENDTVYALSATTGSVE